MAIYIVVLYLVITIQASNSLIFTKIDRRGGSKLMIRSTQDDTAVSTAAALEVSDEDIEKALHRIFADSPCEVDSKELEVEGTFPSWLQGGALLRNGPGMFGTESRRYNHVFDGLAKLTRYSLIEKDGEQRIKFSAKFIKSNMYKGIVEESTVPPSVTTGPVSPEWSTREGIWAAVNSKAFDNVPVNLHQLGGKEGPWVGVTDAPIAVEFDPVTLETKGRREYGPAGSAKARFTGARSDVKLGGYELFSTAHPKTTADGQATVNYFLEAGITTNTALVIKVNSDLERSIVGRVPLGFGQIPYVHEISLAGDKYAVLCIFPLTANPSKMANGKGFLPQLEWKSEEQGGRTLIHVFDLEAVGKAYEQGQKRPDLAPIASYEGPPQFAYHHVNAFIDDETNQLVLDLSAYNTPDIISGEGAFAYIDVVTDATRRRKVMAKAAETYRYTLPLPVVGEVRDIRAVPVPVPVQPVVLPAVDKEGKRYDSELLRIHPQYLGQVYRYSYGFTAYAGEGDREGNWLEWAVVKLDTVAAARGDTTNTAKVWKQRGVFTAEPIFVPQPGQGEARKDKEDDGVLLVQCYDTAKQDSFLLCLDATTMTELGRAYTGMPCPISFHGQWLPPSSSI